MNNYVETDNPGFVSLSELIPSSLEIFIEEIDSLASRGMVPLLFFGMAISESLHLPDNLYGKGNSKKRDILLIAAMSNREKKKITILSGLASRGDSFNSLTPTHPRFHLFERELMEEWNITPINHPWLKPVRRKTSEIFPDEYGKSRKKEIPDKKDLYNFLRMEGTQIHQVAVGPVHAGVIEPGHFRFQCQGENVFHLEIQLGYQHRGIEELMIGSTPHRALKLAESIAGDTCIGHGWACAMIMETLAKQEPLEASHQLRAIALEMERAAIHIGDLGALGGDIAYMMAPSIFADTRTRIINSTLLLCGNRFGRNLLTPGGVSSLPDSETVKKVIAALEFALNKASSTAEIMFDSASVLSRMENTGVISATDADTIGLVGPAGRASGLAVDVRLDHPWSVYRSTDAFSGKQNYKQTGDVLSRALIRYLETVDSLKFSISHLEKFDTYSISNANPERPFALRSNGLSIALTEGWRGEIAHCGITDSKGNFTRYKIKDPSFNNWHGLAMAVRTNGISDFPLCNKSFNLSYCGHDL
ncbi:MAG: hydrogenase [Candidatus Wallbacteria bacterium HGW-Wallbacteria-1]|jgi:Ni,Fe-hydrogenase III large subunit|uniref:Hydrogenase n=1 Tax=Candidatus Wallbacteria bacterium HGW-Wallbacteria-1 TaxID=2013854 RepID=A0A2N1PPT0_9BACT|nr:MAG: hydrogenase [Candidatus Wallbacteria bacterium HGW-Wallbacteria-1]